MLMTPKERLLAAIQHQEPDTVPVCPRGLDVLTQTYGKPWSWQKRLQASKDLDFDFTEFFSIPMLPHPSVRISEQCRDFGEYELVTTVYETPKGDLTQREKRYKNRDAKHVIHNLTTVTVEEFSVKGRSDLEKLPFLYAVPELEAIERFKKAQSIVGENGLIFGAVYSPTCLAVKGFGLENLLMAAVEDPDFVLDLEHVYQQASLRQTEMLLEAGAEVIYMDTTFTSAELWSPRLFKDVVLATIEDQIALIHDAGKIFSYFLCGYSRPFMDIIYDSGIDMFSPVAPPPTGDVNLAEAKAKLGDRICLWGGINVSYDMRLGTPESIREKVKKAIEDAAAGGGYVLGFESALYEWVPLENARAFFKAAREFGRYGL